MDKDRRSKGVIIEDELTRALELPGAYAGPAGYSQTDLRGHELLRAKVSPLDMSDKEEVIGGKKRGPSTKALDPLAVQLLASKGFDYLKNSQDIQAFVVESQDNIFEEFKSRSIEDHLKHHHDMIIVTAIEEAKNISTESYKLKHQSGGGKETWENLLSFVTGNADQLSPDSLFAPFIASQQERYQVPMEEVPPTYAPLRTMSDTTIASTSYSTSTAVPPSTLPSQDYPISSKSLLFVQANAIMESLKTGESVSSVFAKHIVSAPSFDDMSDDDTRPYQDILKLIKTMCHGAQLGQGYFSLINELSQNVPLNSIFGTIPSHQCAYVLTLKSQKYLESISNIPPLSSSDSFWKKIYCSMREGKISQAKHVLDQECLDAEEWVSIILKEYFIREDEALREWPARLHPCSTEIKEKVRTTLDSCRKKLESIYRGEASERLHYGDCDPYKIRVLELFCPDVPLSGGEGLDIGYVIETYLWEHVWKINFRRLFDYGGYDSFSSGISERHLLDEIIEFGGASYFDPEGLHPFSYALILLICHRAGDAVAHLWLNRKYLAAVGIMVISMYHGLILPHLPLITDPNLHANHGSLSLSTSILTPKNLLRQCFEMDNRLQLYHPHIIAPYFLSAFYPYFEMLNRGGMNSVEASERILTSTQNARNACILHSKIVGMELLEDLLLGCSLREESIDMIIGHPDKKGILDSFEPLIRRDNEVEDDYLNSKYSIVDLILLKVARKHLNLRRSVGTGLLFYKKGGLLYELLFDVCTALTSLDELDSDRDFYTYWVERVSQEVKKEMECGRMTWSRRGHGSRLDSHMRDVFIVVMKIYAFFHGLRVGKDEESALAVLERDNILPRSALDVEACIHTWMSASLSSSSTKQAWALIDVLLLRAMEFNVTQARQLEQRSSFGQQALTQKGIQDLSQRSFALIHFATTLDNRINTTTLITLSEAARFFQMR